MPLTVNALLVDPQGKILANLDAQVYTFALAGGLQLVGTGRSGADGKLTVTSTFTASASYQPRVQLRLKRGTAFAEASENPQSFDGTTLNFGTVTFNPVVMARAFQPVLVDSADLSGLRTQVTTLTQTKTTLEKQVTDTQAERDATIVNLQTAQAAELKARDTTIATKSAQLTEAQAQLDAIAKAEVPEISLGSLAQSAAEQLQQTQTALRTNRSGFQLGRVSLQLKVLPGRAGGQVGLPRSADIERVGAEALSQVQLEFNPDSAIARTAKILAPRLSGYTEAVARRKLAEKRLRAEVHYQLVTTDAEAGRVVTQTPAPGAELARDGIVTIAIGRKG